jgi:hypothetical protein
LLARFPRCPSQLLQHDVAAGNFVAAQQGALELRDQQSARLRRELPEIEAKTIERLPTHPAPRRFNGT